MTTSTLDPDVKACAFRIMARREHSQHELYQKLLTREYAQALVKDVVDYMVKEGWQSDERFAENFIRSRINRGYGRIKIQAELNERMVSSSLIAKFLPDDPAKQIRS